MAFTASRFDDGAIESKDHRAILEEVKEETKDGTTERSSQPTANNPTRKSSRSCLEEKMVKLLTRG